MSKIRLRAVRTGIKFDLLAANGQVILTSEVYGTAAACRKGALSVVKNAPAAPVEDRTGELFLPVSNPKFELYRDSAGQFRFRLRAKNGKIIGVSEAYATRAGCENGVESVKKNAAEAEIMEE